jgi:hypothetical protein
MDDAREMTREEAIANLNMISVAFVEPVTKEQRKLIDDTFDMAIKALEQDPCDNCKYLDGDGCRLVFEFEQFGKASDECPNDNNATKTGHREYNDIYDHYLCGKCKTVVMDYDNYCPNCGAKMVEPQESEKE